MRSIAALTNLNLLARHRAVLGDHHKCIGAIIQASLAMESASPLIAPDVRTPYLRLQGGFLFDDVKKVVRVSFNLFYSVTALVKSMG